MASTFGMSTTNGTEKTQHRLRILVVGGSIAGLGCAYTLAKAGHEVVVFEQSDGIWQGPSALSRVPPNEALLLGRWGLKLEDLMKQGGNMEKVIFRHASTSELIHVLDTGGQALEELRAPYIYLHYSVLRARLVQLATDAGADIRHGVEIVHVDPQRPAVHLATGETWIGDLIVGADGANGITQRVFADEEPQHLEPTRVVFSFTIPDDRVRDDPEWEDIVRENEFTIWMSEHSCLLATHVASTRTYEANFVCSMREDWHFPRRWDNSIPISELNLNLAGFKPWIQRFIALGETAIPMPHVTHEPRDDWIHEDSKVVLIGNAAASYPSPGVFGSCVAVEDAEVLGTLLRALRRKDQLPTLLNAFEELRMDRTAVVASADAQMFDAWTNSPAPAEPVDVVHVRSAEDEEAIAKQWDQFFQMCGYNVYQAAIYDATEKAEEWLAQWPGLTAVIDQLPEPVLVEKEVAAHVMS